MSFRVGVGGGGGGRKCSVAAAVVLGALAVWTLAFLLRSGCRPGDYDVVSSSSSSSSSSTAAGDHAVRYYTSTTVRKAASKNINVTAFIGGGGNTTSTASGDQQEEQNEEKKNENDWFDADEWEKNELSESCFYVEDVCHSSFRLFYRPPNNNKKSSKTTAPNNKKTTTTVKIIGTDEYGPRPLLAAIEPLPPSVPFERLHCHDSPVPNHLVLASYYSGMLGEFYDRALFGLWSLFVSVTQQQQQDRRLDEFLERTQLYLLVHEKTTPPSSSRQQLLDSHHLFTGAFRTHPLLNFNVLQHETGCRCLSRLFLCGFSVSEGEWRDEDDDDSTADDVDDDSTALSKTSSTAPSKTASANSSSSVTSLIAKTRLNDEPELGSPLRSMFRDTLRQRIILDNPIVSNDIQRARQDILRQHERYILEEASEPEKDDWKIVGLAQRTGRRRWRDLTLDYLARLRQNLVKDKILLVIVNVEDSDSNPYRQVINHGALDALIGIHGAQMTEAIWMKPGSLVVEVLPYVPEKILLGEWTKMTTQPTPLGVIYDETDLQHIGYPLDRDSAPYCYDDETDLDCWRLKGNPWDRRDFLLPEDAVETMIRRFIVDIPVSCDDFLSRAGNEFVLYNINCRDEGKEEEEEEVKPRHFYWKTQTSPE